MERKIKSHSTPNDSSIRRCLPKAHVTSEVCRLNRQCTVVFWIVNTQSLDPLEDIVKSEILGRVQ